MLHLPSDNKPRPFQEKNDRREVGTSPHNIGAFVLLLETMIFLKIKKKKLTIFILKFEGKVSTVGREL